MRSFILTSTLGAINTLALSCKASPDSIIETDVAIIGGGGTGAYAAVRLREDYKKTVLVIEKTEVLGGHTNVWTDPITNEHFSYGVEVFVNSTMAPCQFLTRFSIPVKTAFIVPATTRFFDFRDGKSVDYRGAPREEWLPALERLQTQWAKYDSMFLPNTAKFPASDDIPEDLMMMWPGFARKYNAEAATQIIHINVVQDPITSTVMDMYRAFDSQSLRVFLGEGNGLQTVDFNNKAVYERSTELLGDDVMYESEVITSKRTDNGVKLVVRSKDGRTVTVKVKRLLITIQPDAASPESLDFDANEQAVLSKSSANQFFVGVVSHPSLPANTTFANSVPEAVPNNHLAYPSSPSLASFRFIGNSSSGGVYRTVMSGPRGFPLEDAKKLVHNNLQSLMDAGAIPAGNASELEFKAFLDHGPMYRSYAVEDLKDDIIPKLNALQGIRSTWRTGAAWGTTNLCMLWALTDTVLEGLTKDLQACQ